RNVTGVQTCALPILAHLLKYDSVHGMFNGDVKAFSDRLDVNGNIVQVVNSREPEKLPWEGLGIDVVIEATGQFRSKEQAGRHVQAGAKKVIITAPGDGVDCTFVMGVN